MVDQGLILELVDSEEHIFLFLWVLHLLLLQVLLLKAGVDANRNLRCWWRRAWYKVQADIAVELIRVIVAHSLAHDLLRHLVCVLVIADVNRPVDEQ